MNQKKVALGLSGGVDSSVAAALLIGQGYEVTGIYLECYNEPGCRTDQDKKDALQVAIKLGIKFEVLDFRKEYKEKVVEYFYREYKAGRTPNPDVMCNREIKFGIFYDWAMQNDFEYVATGHYCRITKDGPLFLQRAHDESKDQSYFLWQIPSDNLSHVLFPLGEMLKSKVRAKAKELGLLTATKPDSMGICFIGDVDVRKLLKDRLGEKPGDVVMITESQKFRLSPKTFARSELGKQGSELCKIGTHKGLWFYTIGQRGGWEMNKITHSNIKPLNQLGINLNNLSPLYVIGKNMGKNELIVGERKETMKVSFNILDKKLQLERKVWARIRNLGELHEVVSIKEGVVTLKDSVFAPSEGQSCVFYDQNKLLVAGSIIV